MELSFFNVAFYSFAIFIIGPAIYLLTTNKSNEEVKGLAFVIYPFAILLFFGVLIAFFGLKETFETLTVTVGKYIIGSIALVALVLSFTMLVLGIAFSGQLLEKIKDFINARGRKKD